MNKIIQFIFLIIVAVLLFSVCSKNKIKNFEPDNIIATVGEDTIFVNDIIRRSEYSVRPPYCDGNNIIDKRIILNSLIAEKLFAKEAEEDNKFEKSLAYKARLQGIKEQLMREKLVTEEVVDKIKISQEEINQAYINSKKIVNTEAVFIPKFFEPQKIYETVQNGVPLSQLSTLYTGISEVIERQIKWGTIDEAAQAAIFNSKVKKGTIIPPLPTKGGYRLIKVKSWVEEIELSPGNVDLQKESIKSKIKDYYIQLNYNAYAKKIMKGKTINFSEDGWNVLVNLLKKIYFSKNDSTNLIKDKDMKALLTNHLNDLLMEVEGKNWTISEFIYAIKVHPLEINHNKLNIKNFPLKLQAAIASFITDSYLTEICYEKEYDNSHDVNRAVQQWDTFYKAGYQRTKILDNVNFNAKITIDYLSAFKKYLNPYFENLKIKYDNLIRFNPDALKNMELTTLQTVTYKEKGPYKEVVPSFPLLTNSNKTNYKYFPFINEK